jgi:hypothetical protein
MNAETRKTLEYTSFGVLGAALLVFKVFKLTDLPWVLVLAPFWIPAVLGATVFLGCCLAGLVTDE